MRRTIAVLVVGVLLSVLAAGTALASTQDGRVAAGSDLIVKKLGSSYYEREKKQIVIAPSAKSLSRVTGEKVRDSGRGTYLRACWGSKPTGGYSVAVNSASKSRDGVAVDLKLKKPGSGAVTQAETHPCTTAVVQDLNPEGKAFSFFAQDGRGLDWPVRRVSR